MAPPAGSNEGSPAAASEQATLYPFSPRGFLSASYESRFGGAGALLQDVSPGVSSPSPRSPRRPGVTAFTDPRNPFGRPRSKQMGGLLDARNDASRAGNRTRDAGVLTIDLPAAQIRQQGTDVRERLVPYRYGNPEDWRPGRAAATCASTGQRSPRGCNSEGVGEALGATCGTFVGWAPAAQKDTRAAVLGNYLNDMKRAGRTRGAAPAQPSDFLQRMNNTRTMLPAEMTSQRRAASADVGVPATPRRSANAESEGCAVYGFSRKRPVSGRASRPSAPDFLRHEASPAHSATPRMERQKKAEERFEEVVAHMKAATTLQKEQVQAFKERNRNSDRLLYSESVVKYAV